MTVAERIVHGSNREMARDVDSGGRHRMLDAVAVRPLLEQCQGHDRIAFAELFERYHQRVFSRVYVIAPRSEAADDIMQLVYVELFAGAVAVSLILLAHVTHGVQNATQTVITMVKQIASGTSDRGTPSPQGTLLVPNATAPIAYPTETVSPP